MSNIEIVPITEENYDELFSPESIRELERGYMERIPNFRAIMIQTSKIGTSGAVFIDGELVTRMGFVVPYPGVCEVWQIPSTMVFRHRHTYARLIRQYFESLAVNLKFHRIQTVCPDDLLHRRWMQYLGFEFEGVLRQYTTDKQDRLMYARIYDHGY